MKGRSSHKVQREFPELRRRYWGCRFWGRGYFSTTNGAITEDIVLQYLEQHIADLVQLVVQWACDRTRSGDTRKDLLLPA
jgi:hypothetical protein